MKKETDNTLETDVKQDKPWLWKKGFCPNPGGRPAGKSMKAYAKEYLSKLTDEEKDEWLEGMDKEIIFKMAEGNPKTDTDITSGGEKIASINPTDPTILANLKAIQDKLENE
jgi:hypothetical protein